MRRLLINSEGVNGEDRLALSSSEVRLTLEEEEAEKARTETGASARSLSSSEDRLTLEEEEVEKARTETGASASSILFKVVHV